jgi:hypothetical protein
MRPKLTALAARQGGLITRSQALAAGYSLKEIRTLTKADGPWVPVRRGVYGERVLVEKATTWTQKMLLGDRAAHLMIGQPHLMSHDSAVRLHDLPMLRPAEPLVHVTRFGVGGSRTEEGVKHHLTRLGLLDAPLVDGLRVTGLARTALDVAREHGFRDGVGACDAVLQRGVQVSELEEHLALMWSWPGVRSARAAVEAADAGAESLGESLMRIVLEELDLGPVETQFPVVVDGRAFWCDARVGRHMFEFDGLVKYLRREAGGLVDQEVNEIVWEEKRRQDAICGRQLGMSRVVWSELLGRRRDHLKLRLAREHGATSALFGDRLPPEMLADAARLRPQRLLRRRTSA